MKTNLSPVAAINRIETLDVIRGLAIFGILVVNMEFFFQPVTTLIIGYQGHESLLDKMVDIIIRFFFQGKFYPIFSFLFGYGFFHFINKKTNGTINPLPLFGRRAFFLLMFGIVHVVLLWSGDILINYALFGFLLIFFRKVSDKGVLRWIKAFAIITLVVTILFPLFFYTASSAPDAAGQSESMQQITLLHQRASEIYPSGSFIEVTKMRLAEYSFFLTKAFFGLLFLLPLFLLGYLAARRGILKNIGENAGVLKKAAIWGLAVGAPLSVLSTYTYFNINPLEMNWMTLSSYFSNLFGGIFLGMFYISGLALLLHKGKLAFCKKQLAPVGRMALTNYLTHSIVCTTLFYSYGFGLFGKITLWQGLLLSFVIFGLQIPLSRWWLSKFNFGPFEWLWRSLTYWKLQPFKKA